jgi:hypothetical protein
MENTLIAHEKWSYSRKLSFRFIFILLALFILPFPITFFLQLFNEFFLDVAFNDLWNWASELVATNILGIEEIPTGNQGSGDKTIDWIRHGIFVFVAVIGTIVWSFLDGNRKNYYKLWRWFVLAMVYYLVSYMLIYGFIKVFWLQMPELRIDRLLKTYGQSSPMGLLWTFMGASKTYSMYAGFSEVIAGTLLIFRRTRTLGGLVTFGVMFNVFILNIAYDVPVKLFSAQLMLMGLYIAMIDRKAILGLLLFQKSEKVTPWPKFFKNPVKNYMLLAIQVFMIGYMFYNQIDSNLERRAQYGELRPKSALYGLYDVEHYIKNGDTIPPLLTDDERWQRVIFEDPDKSIVIHMDDQLTYYTSSIDTTSLTLTFSIGRDSLRKDYPMTYEKLEDGLLVNGVLKEDTLSMKLKTYDMSNFYLKSRGFNWINEVPFHRYHRQPKDNW